MSEICSMLHHFLNQLRRYHYPYDADKIIKNGIYIIFERGEFAHGVDRIVRVGSHSSDDCLVMRINEHFINENKDRSIFRKNIGRAILNKSHDPYLSTWEIDLTSRLSRERYAYRVDHHRQEQIEAEVTKILHSNFSFCVIPVEGKENRKYFDARLIATVAQCTQCRPSKNWFGLYSTKEKIRSSGLWNYQHVGGDTISQIEFERLTRWLQE